MTISLYENLTDAEVKFDINLEYPRRLLLQAGHPSLCMPKVLEELNYSARRGALFMFFHPPCADSSVDIFLRIRNGPGSKELIRAIISFL
jgi:hypothetical protein